MNELPAEQSFTDTADEVLAEVDQCVRRNPGTALLVAVGTGLVIGLLVRALRPEPTAQRRVADVLEDIECRLRDFAEPALRNVGTFASEGASAIQEGLHTGEARFERLLRDARKRLRKILS